MRRALSEIKLLLGGDTLGNTFERANTAMALAAKAVAEQQETMVMLTVEQAQAVLDGWNSDTAGALCRGSWRDSRFTCECCQEDRRVAENGKKILRAAIKQAATAPNGVSHEN